MEEERLTIFSLEDFSRYTGNYKKFTKNCEGCEYHTIINSENRCYWGVAWKRLIKKDRMRKCEYVNKRSPRKKMLMKRQELLERLKRDCEEVRDWKPDPNKPSYAFDIIRGRTVRIK